MITPAYESFINDICTDYEYNIANENAIVDGITKVIETIKMLWKKLVNLVTSMVKKLINFFKKAPKEASVDEINKADKETAKKSGDSKFDKNASQKYSLSEKADSREAIRKKRDEMTRNNQSKDYMAAMKDEAEVLRLSAKEAKKKQAEAQRVKEEQEAEAKKKQEEKWRKELKARDKEIVKKVILSEDAYYWCTNAQSYIGNIGLYYDDVIEIAKDDNATIDDASKVIDRIEKILSKKNPNDLHTLESDYINGAAGTPESQKIGYMSYELFLIKSKKTVNNISYYINETNKKIQNISEIHDAELANKVLELSRKLISFYQQILNNVNNAIQTARSVNIRRKDGYGKSFD